MEAAKHEDGVVGMREGGPEPGSPAAGSNRTPWSPGPGPGPEGARGLSIAEMAVAVAVGAVLICIAIPVGLKEYGRTRVESTRTEMAAVAHALQEAARQHAPEAPWGRFPAEHPGTGSYRSVLGPEANALGDEWHPARRGSSRSTLDTHGRRGDAFGTGEVVELPEYQLDAWRRAYLYRNRAESGERVGPRDTIRVVELISGGPDRDPATAEDNIRILVYRGPVD